ncbi:hypothetical protein TNCV_4469341 [Trichonephila clavipes]|nr:hypothetical protein TNCV_4469341 [Trichonephila clavipes]
MRVWVSSQIPEVAYEGSVPTYVVCLSRSGDTVGEGRRLSFYYHNEDRAILLGRNVLEERWRIFLVWMGVSDSDLVRVGQRFLSSLALVF